jgi:Dna[CI] antecedent, DciA
MESIAPGVEKIVAGSLRKAPASEAPLLAWPVVCGSAVAARTRALEFSRGVLRVEVPDAAWRAELQHLAPRYVAIANKYAAGVSRIDFVVRGKAIQSSEETAQK